MKNNTYTHTHIYILTYICIQWLSSKESACSVGEAGFITGSGGSLGGGNGNSLQYSGLENHMHRGAWQATVHGSQRDKTEWLNTIHTPPTRSWRPLDIPSLLPQRKGGSRLLPSAREGCLHLHSASDGNSSHNSPFFSFLAREAWASFFQRRNF